MRHGYWFLGPIIWLFGLASVLSVSMSAQAAIPAGPVENGLIVRRSPQGQATFIRPARGGVIPVAPAAGQVAVQPMDFLKQHGHLFGLTDANRQLAVDLARTHTDGMGHRHTTFAQVHRGVSVFSGVLKVHQNAVGGVVAANGDFYQIPDKLNLVPTLALDRATALAQTEISAFQAGVEHGELVIVDPAWYGDAPKGVRLAYHLILADAGGRVREALFIDAHSGETLDRWNLLHTAQDRRVYNVNGGSILPGTLARSEGQVPDGSMEVNLAYDYSGDFYGYLQRGFQRDSIDDDGLMLISSVNFDRPNFCPNAQWNGEQTVYCAGATSDDVVGHEFAHGLTDYTANLIYQNQSGMLNESFSDVFGELVDLFNGNAAFVGPPEASGWPIPFGYVGGGLDTPNELRSSMSGVCDDGPRWLVSEDATVAFGGAIRDMWNPPCFNDPSTLNSVLMVCAANDNGGVHSGSGVGNHAFAILVDGKAFNGQTVTGIGPIKAGAVWYRALTTYLTIASDYADAYDAFNQAAQDLVGSTPLDPRTGVASGTPFSAADAQEVDKALLAVEMNTDGRCGKAVDVLDSSPPPHCVPRFAVYSDDFESGAPGWTVNHFGPAGPPTPYDWVLRGNLPFQRAGQAWFCADPSIGDCGPNDESAVHQLFSPTINLPTILGSPFLSFTHYLASEPSWDGGNVKLSTNGGPFQAISANRFTFNAYNAVLETTDGGNTNPLAGEPAWTGAGGRWGTSLVDLFALVQGGDSVRLLFDFGKDGCTGIDGWYVDDVEIYDCLCMSNAQCADSDPCTNDMCQFDGTCVHAPLPCLGIASSDPPSGAVDARAPHDIGNVLPPLGLIHMDLTFIENEITGLTPLDFTLEKQGGSLPAPLPIDVSSLDADTVRLTWSEPLEPASWLKITHTASTTAVCIGSLPGDGDGNGLAATDDVTALTTVLAALPGLSPSPLSTDMDHSGAVDAFDLTRLLDVLNGAGAFDPWLGAMLPPCPGAGPPGMAFIPGGEFLMGNPFNDGVANELPRHPVYVDPFYMDRYEVTNQQYADALNWALGQGNLITVTNGVVYKANSGTSFGYCDSTTSSQFSRITWNDSVFGVVAGKENHPMVQVSWWGSAAYANWRSGMEGRTPSYDTATWSCNFAANGYRLPTEAEWEKAARGGASGRRFPWSDSDTIQHARANYYSDSSYAYDTSPTRGFHPRFSTGGIPYTSPVGYFAPNGYGLHDMAGNVWEWGNDWWDGRDYTNSPYDNPHGLTSGGYRVIRGGSWGDDAYLSRCAFRYYLTPDSRALTIGFRLALDSE